MSFGSDNWAGTTDRVMSVLAEANEGLAPAYGHDSWTGRARDLLSEQFQTDVAAFFVGTGTAANSLSLAQYARPGGIALCHPDAHVGGDEAGAPHLFSAGLQIDPVDGPAGRIAPRALSERLSRFTGNVHHGRPVAVSIANVNELGQCYSTADVAEIAAIARRYGCAVHMDGARFVNALARTGASPADLTWRAGVDVLSLGLTKCGAWCAEAVILFDTKLREDFSFRQMQAAQLFSKSRFVAAQFVAMLEDNHALGLAAHANGMADRIAATMRGSAEASLLLEPQANEVFAYLAPQAAERLRAAGIAFAPWQVRSAHIAPPPHADWTLSRFIASFRTTEAEIDALAAALGHAPAAANA
ncbi:MAG: low specificity L-threonine aldolase [Acuticoccus sp.]